MAEKLLTLKDIRSLYNSDKGFALMLRRYDYLFPIKGSVELAGIVADLMGDGNLQGFPKWRFDFCSKDINELEVFGKKIKLLFNVSGKIRPCTTNSYGESYLYGVNCKPLARSLYLIGVPSGEKIFQEFVIPEWILKNKEYFREFIYRLFECEGTVDYTKGSCFIELKMSKVQYKAESGIFFFNQIKDYLLNYFGIICTNVFLSKEKSSRKDKIETIRIRLKIKRKKDILKFIKEIGFPSNEEKKKKLYFNLKRNT